MTLTFKPHFLLQWSHLVPATNGFPYFCSCDKHFPCTLLVFITVVRYSFTITFTEPVNIESVVRPVQSGSKWFNAIASKLLIHSSQHGVERRNPKPFPNPHSILGSSSYQNVKGKVYLTIFTPSHMNATRKASKLVNEVLYSLNWTTEISPALRTFPELILCINRTHAAKSRVSLFFSLSNCTNMFFKKLLDQIYCFNKCCTSFWCLFPSLM